MPLSGLWISLIALTAASPAPTEEAAKPAVEAEVGSSGDTPPEAEGLEGLSAYVEVPNPAFPALPIEALPRPRHPYGPADLAPYFSQGPLGEAKLAFDRGAYGRTLALTRGSQTEALPVRYLRAQAALKAKDYQLAAEELTALAKSYPVLADRCLVGAAAAREGLGELDVASQLLAQVPAQSRLWVDARLTLARLLVQQKQRVEAAEVLDSVTAVAALPGGRDIGAEALWARSELARHEGKRVVEREALTRLWALHPLSALAVRAEARLGGAPNTPSALVDRAEVLVEGHRNRQGLRLLEPLLTKLALPDPLACRAHFIAGKALRKERAHTRAQQVLEPVAAKCEGELRPRALYVLGTSQSIVAPERGIQTYDTLSRDFPEHPFADDALFYAADLCAKQGRPADALERLETLAQRYPTGDFAAEGLFRAFWIHRHQGERPAALAQLDEIERRYADADESYELERARYWRARMAEDGGEKGEAAERMASLASEHPATYYGLRAREWLARLDPERLAKLQPQLQVGVPSAPSWPLDAGAFEDDPHFPEAVQLLRLGFGEAAAAEFTAVKRVGASIESLRLLVRLIALTGDVRTAHAIARTSLRRDLAGRVTSETRPIWEIAYPNAFRKLVEKHCKVAGLDPDLLQALMREESALDPKALSWAGALGLTQLMPSTARSVAKSLKLRMLPAGKLLDPEMNIRLGATYLSQLLKREDGNPSFALASYNAGASAVDRWRADASGEPLDAWVEEIPLAETRGYVKRVLRSYNTYRLLYGAPPSGAPVGAAVAADGR